MTPSTGGPRGRRAARLALTMLLLAAAVAPSRLGHARQADEPDTDRPAAPIPAEAICRGGERLLEDAGDGSLRHARDLFQAGVRHYPRASCVHAGLARALVMLHHRQLDPDETVVPRAVEAAARAREIQPESAAAGAAAALALLADLRPEEAEDRSEEALALQPESPGALEAAAQVRTARRRLGPAREAAERLVALRPDLPSAHLLLGNLKLLAGDPGGAVESYDVALALSPRFTPADLQRGIAYAELGDLRGSGRIFERLLEERPEARALIHVYMAHSLMERNSFNAALAVLERADFTARRGLCNGTVLYMKALCLERLGRRPESRAAYREVIDRWPDATAGPASPERLVDDAYEGLGRLLLEAGEIDAAVQVMEEGAGRAGAGVELCLRLARIFNDYKLPGKALPLLERAARRDPGPRTIGLQMAAYVVWARTARQAGDQEALARLRDDLQGRADRLRGLRDFGIDLEAARALSIAASGESALEWLRHAVGLGYSQLGWIDGEADFEALRAAPGYRDLVRGVTASSPTR